MTLDRPRLIKLLMMTTSTNDGEALVAIRKANKLLSDNNSDWARLLGLAPALRPSAPKPPPKPQGRGVYETRSNKYDDPDINRMIDALLRDKPSSGFRTVLESWKQHVEDHGYLTRNQYDALVNAFERAK